MDGFLEVALEYAELGFAVFPCVPGGKKPACDHGCNDATTDVDTIMRWWDRDPSRNVAIATQGLIVVDIDGHSNPWLSSLGDKIDDLMGCPAAWTPSGGTHLYFRQPPEGSFRCSQSVLAPNVDIRADGGYVVAPPSNRTEGGGYRWMPDREIERLIPEPPAWLIKLLQKPMQQSESVRARDETPAEPIPSGDRNGTLTRIAGKMRRFGMTGRAIEAAIQATNCERCDPPLEPTEVAKIAASVAKYAPDQVATMGVEGAELVAFEQPAESEPFPQELLYPEGMLAKVMDFNLDAAFREQPILALAGALALLSTITGRKVQDDYGTRTNLFLLSVAASGSGKERARVVNKSLLYHAGGERHVGPERAASATGIVSALGVEPSLLLQFDEFGRYLKAATSKTAGAHLSEITTTLMRLFTSSGEVFLGDAYADSKKNASIDQPHAVLYGTTVPSHLYESLTTDSISDGFMSRLLIFESEDEAPRYCRGRKSLPPPKKLVDDIRTWIEERPAGGNLGNVHPAPRVIPTTKDAAEHLDALQDTCWEREKNKTDPYRSLWTRCVEKARKLALLHACSRRAPEIDREAAEWGAKLSEHLTCKLACVGRQWVSESPHQAHCQRVYRWLVDRGGRATKRELARSMRHLKKHEREAVLEDLIEIHGISVQKESTGGRPSEVIAMAGNLLAHNSPHTHGTLMGG